MFKILLVFYLSTRVTRNNAYPLKGMYEEWTDDQGNILPIVLAGVIAVMPYLGDLSYLGERAKSEMLLATWTIWPDADSTLINL